MEERGSAEGLFAFESDIATVHVDTPWMRVTMQIHQNKVAREGRCAFARLDVWISDINPKLVRGPLGGVLGDDALGDDDAKENEESSEARELKEGPRPRGRKKRRIQERALTYKEGGAHRVDGHFGIWVRPDDGIQMPFDEAQPDDAARREDAVQAPPDEAWADDGVQMPFHSTPPEDGGPAPQEGGQPDDGVQMPLDGAQPDEAIQMPLDGTRPEDRVRTHLDNDDCVTPLALLLI